MKKRMLVLVLSLLLSPLLLPVSIVYAQDGEVIYDGNAREFIFEPGSQYSPTDLFSNFKDVMPGDSLTQRIHIKNEASKQVKVRIYLRALGAHEESEDFLSQLHLRIQPVQDPDIYLFDAQAHHPGQLTDWVCLGVLYSGGEIDLDVTLDVPVELDNSYSSQIGYLDWEFMVEELPIESSDPQRPDVTPDTGDSSHPVMWSVLGLGAVVMIVLMIWRKKREMSHE